MTLPLVFACFLMRAPHVFITDFGASANSRKDCCLAIQRALNALPSSGGVVEFPKGDYHFFRENGLDKELYLSNSDVANPRKVAILLENRKGIRLEGNGSRLIFHDRILPIAVLNCQDITIHGLTLDWQRPLMSQGTVESADSTGLVLRIDPKTYPYAIEDGKLWFSGDGWKRRSWAHMEFDPKTRGVAYNTGDSGITDGSLGEAKVTDLGGGRVRFAYSNKFRPKVGDVLVMRHGVRDHAGTYIQDSKGVTLDQVYYRHTSGLGVLCQYSENLTFRQVEVAPEAGSSRLFAGHDDGFHFSNCKGHIDVSHCRFEGLMDDPINVHGTAVRIQELVDPTHMRCRFMHPQSVGLRFGDAGNSISFIDHESMLIRGVGEILSIKHLSVEEFEVEFSKPFPRGLVVGDALENLTWTPSVRIADTQFGTVRARGLLLSTPRKAVIENCLFRSSGAAILIPGDANGWYESGAVNDVTIRHNRFENCNTSSYQFGDAVISVHPEIPKLGTQPFHRHIHIEDNTFVVFDSPVLWAKSVADLTFVRNKIDWSGAYAPRLGGNTSLTFIGCENVSVSDNILDPRFLAREVRVQGGNPNSIHVSGWQ